MTLPVRRLLRVRNRAKILDVIRMHDAISRMNISNATGLSQASVTGLTADLIEEGLILEQKVDVHKKGRRPTLLTINPDGAFVVGVHLSAEELSVVIVNFRASVLTRHTERLNSVKYTVEAIADRIARTVQTCIWEANFSKDQIAGVGIGLPGLVDSHTGLVRFMPNYEWKNVNLRDLVQQMLNHPTYIDNSSNTLALAEQWFGMGKGVENFLVVTIENGIGLGCVINGRLYRGFDGLAGEFGHIMIQSNGRSCRCGKNGCIEAYAGNIAILHQAQKAARDGIWQPEEPQHISYDGIVAAAQNGTRSLHEIFTEAGRILGKGIAHLATLFNPTRIIITGKGVQAGDILFDSMHKNISRHLSSKFGRSATEILIQEWDDTGWARGAGALVLREIYKSPVSEAVTPS